MYLQSCHFTGHVFMLKIIALKMPLKTVNQQRRVTDLRSTAKRVEHIKEHKTRESHGGVTWSNNVVSHLY